MRPTKKNPACGVITFHTPLPVGLLKSEEDVADVKDATESRESPSQPSARKRSTSKCVIAEKREEASPPGSQLTTRQDWLSHASLRQLQAKVEAENQQLKEIIQPLLATENGFLKELERFLSQRDVAELRRRELQHKRWTERVWIPLQRRVEDHVSSCSPVEAKRRQSLYSHYLHHCNAKGFVFLETYDLREYNPFLLNFKKPHYLKLSREDFKEPLYLQLHESQKEKRRACSCETGCKYKPPQSVSPLSEYAASQADILRQASSNYAASASPAKDEAGGRECSRLDTVPYHIKATAAPDGWCHQNSCFFSRCASRQQPASLHQSSSSSK
ncbi:protein FAM228A [Pagrus major]|uniref:protein FAM228A n=1 Tax=Pagrus major TaxID=143350 RepID=UPI003CC8AD89